MVRSIAGSTTADASSIASASTKTTTGPSTPGRRHRRRLRRRRPFRSRRPRHRRPLPRLHLPPPQRRSPRNSPRPLYSLDEFVGPGEERSPSLFEASIPPELALSAFSLLRGGDLFERRKKPSRTDPT